LYYFAKEIRVRISELQFKLKADYFLMYLGFGAILSIWCFLTLAGKRILKIG